MTRPIDLVAEDRGVLRDAPLVVQDGEIGVTQAAVFDGDLDVLGAERAEVDAFEHHRLLRRLGDPRLVIRLAVRFGSDAGSQRRRCLFDRSVCFRN